MEKIFDIYQEEIIHCQNDILVIAGPGSGKTTTILAKVNYLLKMCDIKDILLISFTNKSVNDIKNRINKDVYVTTFHKLAIDILKCYQIPYHICDESLLNYIIDEYFLTNISSLKKLNIKPSSYEYQSLKRLIISFISLFKTNNFGYQKLVEIKKQTHDKFLYSIILNILKIYEQEKQSSGLYDFDDMIIKATKLLKDDYRYKKFKYIIIDEFQDTSMIRFELIKTIYDHCDCTITCVGDDAQSIFHFTGCDIKIMLNFNHYFPSADIKYLKNTYRNSKELIHVSQNFINKNPYQIPKKMISNITQNKPIEIIYYINPILKFKKLLNNLKTDNVLILARNKNDIFEYIDNYFLFDGKTLKYKDKTYPYLTIHSAKGLESDYVIILNCSNKIIGIPNKIENHPLLNYFNQLDDYPFSEERRIFFVGITRCKIKTFLMVPRNNPSPFIQEIIKYI